MYFIILTCIFLFLCVLKGLFKIQISVSQFINNLEKIVLNVISIFSNKFQMLSVELGTI